MATYNGEVLVATMTCCVLVGTKPNSKLGSTIACSSSGNTSVGTTSAHHHHYAVPCRDLLWDITVLCLR